MFLLLATLSIGERQDREIVATPDEVTIRTKAKRNNTVRFTVNRWAHFTAVLLGALCICKYG